jgi:hypothetical protein
MKLITALLCLLFFSVPAFAQDSPDHQMVYNLTLDSILTPDYYNVNITVAESVAYERVGKKNYKTYIVPVDTLSQRLLRHLSGLGFTGEMQKSTITEVDNNDGYYQNRSDKKLFQVTYKFRIASKDSIDLLFHKLDKEVVSSMKISPALYDATIEKVRQELVVKGTALSEKYANDIAQKLNQKIIKSKYNIVFYDGGLYGNYGDDSFNKKFVIDYRNINYKLSVSYTYTLAEK